MRTRIALLLTVAASLTALAGTADAATVTYRNDTALSIPNNTGTAGLPTAIQIPTGRTPVESIDVPGVKPVWAGGGGTDMSMRLVGPTGDEMFLMTIGCATMANTTNFTVTDSATVQASNSIAFCNNELVGGSGRPNDPDSKTLAFWKGKPSSGTWTLFVRDAGVNGTSGNFNGWGLRVTHAPFVPTLTATKQPLKKSVKFTATCNADCTATTGGDLKAKAEKLNQNNSELLSAKLKSKARKRLAEKGKAKVTVTFDDGYGDTLTQTVKVKFKR